MCGDVLVGGQEGRKEYAKMLRKVVTRSVECE